jgi:hypothetical protein
VGDDDESGEQEPRSEIKSRRQKEVLMKIKEGETVLDL